MNATGRGDNDRVTMSPSLFAALCVARERLRECDDDSAPMVAEIARLAGLSTFRFIRRFALSSAPRLINTASIRASSGRARLITTDRPVTEVCLEVGFTSLGSFSSLFARRVGVPSAYRRRDRCVVPGRLPPKLTPGCLSLMAAAFAISEKRAAPRLRRWGMRIKLTSIMVDDQNKALKFYTDVFGFEKKHEIPVGEYQVADGCRPRTRRFELSLEPNANPAGKAFQEAIFKQGIPLAAFEVDDRRPNSRG